MTKYEKVNEFDDKEAGGGLTELGRKMKVLEASVEMDRPMPIEFVGKRYYTQEYIGKANKELSDKLSHEFGENDEFAHSAEYMCTYAINNSDVLGNCSANPASEYDDHINGVDIVCSLSDKESKKHVFGIDITTATLSGAVSDKFQRGNRPRGQVPKGCSFIKFYRDNGYFACLKGVPRFVIGMSPSGVQKYLDKFDLDDDSGVISHKNDSDLSFNILSSLFVQSKALCEELKMRPNGDPDVCARAVNTCEAVMNETYDKLKKIMNVVDEKDFIKTLNKEIAEAMKEDKNHVKDFTYNLVISESISRLNATKRLK